MADLSQKEWCDQLKQDDDAVILDVRTAEEIEEGFIKGAVAMDIRNTAEFYENAQKLDPSKKYYIYCRSGGRSGQACALFNSLGIKDTYNLVGGILAWNGELIKEHS